jgi:hypothetical protein
MKSKLKMAGVAAALLLSTGSYAQTADKSASATGEQFGNTLNLGLGLGYGGIGGGPGLLINYEFGVAKNFTIAPFIGFQTYSGTYYRHSILPIGAKGTYYFDELLNASSDWDFYLAASLGYSVNSITYDAGYTGKGVKNSNLFLVGHIGAEYHVSNKVGVFLDLGSGLSTLGVAIHM